MLAISKPENRSAESTSKPLETRDSSWPAGRGGEGGGENSSFCLGKTLDLGGAEPLSKYHHGLTFASPAYHFFFEGGE